MANDADILIRVGAKGEFTVNGESGSLIKRQLEAQLKNGIQIKVGINEKAVASSLQAQLNNAAKGLKINVGAGASPITGAHGTQSIQADTAARMANANAGQQQAAALSQANKAQANSAKVTAQATSALASLGQYLNTVKPTALKEMSAEIATITAQLDKARLTGDRSSLDVANNGIKTLRANMKSIGAEGGNAFTYLEGKLKSFAIYLASSALTMGFVSAFRNAVNVVYDLDEAMTDLRIITGKTNTQAKDLITTYNQLAQELGSTTSAVSSGAQDWLRQGYSLEDTNELLRQSMALSIMGNMSSEEATTSLTAALKGYRLEVEQASDVVDKFFAVDMAAATSSAKMAEALAKTAANAKLAGLNLNDVIGQLAVVNETLQEDGSQTGTFYNTMLSRMGMIKAGRLEDPESGESLSDVETTLGGLGIKLRDSETEFRNFGDVLDEVAVKWDGFSSVSQRAIATAFAGKMCA